MHFISGLPRAGSTLLAGILSQNPKFHALGITSPVGELFAYAVRAMGANNENYSLLGMRKRAAILRSIYEGHYFDVPGDKIILDTSRFWCSQMGLVAKVFPQAKVLVCVREPAWIFNSIERALRKHPLIMSKIYPAESAANIYSRADHCAHPVHGLLGFAWHSTKEAWFGEYRNRLLIIEYDRLASDPARVIEEVYGFLELEPYKHDFNNVALKTAETAMTFDWVLGVPGLHALRPKVEPVPEPSVVPPDLYLKLSWPCFWRGDSK